MMMKKIFILITVLSISLMFSSCEGFLDVKPSNSGDSASSIQSEDDAAVFMRGIMRKISSSSYLGRNFILYGDAKGGDLGIVSQGRGSDALYVFNHSKTSNSYSGYWSQMYHCLAQINTLIANVDKLDKEGKMSDGLAMYKAEALTLRAMIHFDLVRIYGQPYQQNGGSSLGVPVVIAPTDASDQPTRATVAQVYEQIVADLQAAETSGDLAQDPSDREGFINHWGNLAIQARVFQTMGDNTKALKAAEAVINSSKFTLYGKDEWVSSWSKQFGSESIFELSIYPDEGDMGTGSLGFYYRRYKDGSTRASGWFMASDYWLTKIDEDPQDIRKGIMSYDEIADDRFGACYKYSGGVDKGGDGKSSSTAVNIKVIRLSEMYLIAAEAALASDKNKAANYLNEIRGSRSSNLALATASTVSLDMVLNEKSKEFFGEGLRYFDMLRLGKDITFCDEMITPNVPIPHRDKTINTWNFFKCILPIGQGEIDANPAIASQQNPGY